MNLTRRELLKSLGAGMAGVILSRLPHPPAEKPIPPIDEENIGENYIEFGSNANIDDLPESFVSTVFYFQEDAEDESWHSHVWYYEENKPVRHILDGEEVFRLEQEGPVRMQVHLQPHPESRSWTMHGVSFETWNPSVPPTFTIGTEEMIGL